MKSTKVLLMIAAAFAILAGVAGLVMGSKRAKVNRFRKKAGMMVYNIGTALRILSCQCMDEQ